MEIVIIFILKLVNLFVMSSVAAYRTLYPGEFYEKFLSEEIRPDGRDPLGTRKVNISTGQ